MPEVGRDILGVDRNSVIKRTEVESFRCFYGYRKYSKKKSDALV
jgi:hypothetical protein